MNQKEQNTLPPSDEPRLPYCKPEVQRVDLALEETLTAGCKLDNTACTDPFPGLADAGS
jgi:hypothetical protein